MKIIDIINSTKRSLSFEVFPPKTDDKYEVVLNAVKEIAKLSPSYMSVTYGAGGGTSAYTAKIAQELSESGVPSLAHLTCISSSKREISEQLSKLKNLGINNILALRGDVPYGFDRSKIDFNYAYQLIDEIKKHGDFCIGGACYPEAHPESISAKMDILYLKNKVEHGCDFLTTQMFFDNEIFYSFIDNIRKEGINVPVIPGLMPVTSTSMLDRIVFLSGNSLPSKFMKMVDKYSSDPLSFREAGIEYATKQAEEIYENGFNAVHIYSMNKPDVAEKIQYNLLDVIK
jgi:methylenetetrahydrofolate reductase (NADPH)